MKPIVANLRTQNAITQNRALLLWSNTKADLDSLPIRVSILSAGPKSPAARRRIPFVLPHTPRRGKRSETRRYFCTNQKMFELTSQASFVEEVFPRDLRFLPCAK